MMKEIRCDEICDLFKALGHPVRMKILYYLMDDGKHNVNKLCELLGIPQSTTSQQISVLRNHGIISARKRGADTFYYITDQRVIDIIKMLRK